MLKELIDTKAMAVFVTLVMVTSVFTSAVATGMESKEEKIENQGHNIEMDGTVSGVQNSNNLNLNSGSSPSVKLKVSLTPNKPGEVTVRAIFTNFYKSKGLKIANDRNLIKVKSKYGFKKGSNFFLKWDGTTSNPVITYRIKVSRSDVDKGSWAFLNHRNILPQTNYNNPNWKISTQIIGNGFAREQYIYLGTYQKLSRSIKGQKVTIAIAKGAKTTKKKAKKYMELLEKFIKTIKIKGKDKSTLILITPKYIAGSCGSNDFARINEGGSQTKRTVIHEYLHTRENFLDDPDANNDLVSNDPQRSSWLNHGMVEYYTELFAWREGITHKGQFYGLTVKQGKKSNGILADSSTWGNAALDRDKGPLVVAALDAKIRKLTEGKKSFQDVFRRMNQHSGKITLTDFHNIVARVAGKRLDKFIYKYTRTRANPDLDNVDILYGVDGDAYNIDSPFIHNVSLPGTYNLTMDWDRVSKAVINIRSSNVTFDGKGHVIGGVYNSEPQGIVIKSPPGKTYKNITVKNVTLQDYPTGIKIRDVNRTDVRNVTVRDSTTGIDIRTSGIKVMDSYLLNNSIVGVYANGSDNKIVNTVARKNSIGFSLVGDYNDIQDSELYNNSKGIFLINAYKNSLRRNKVVNSRDVGVLLRKSNSVLVTNTVKKSKNEDVVLENSVGHIQELNIGNSTRSNMSIDLYGKDVSLKAVDNPPKDPKKHQSIGRYVKIQKVRYSSSAQASLRLFYDEKDFQGNELALSMWKHNGSWSKVSDSKDVIEKHDYVKNKANDFGVFGLMIPKNKAPNAGINNSPNIAVPNQQMTFDASDSFDPDGEIVLYKWKFGDGTVKTTEKPKINHIFEESGEYTVTLKVVDNRGEENKISKVVEVREESLDFDEYVSRFESRLFEGEYREALEVGRKALEESESIENKANSLTMVFIAKIMLEEELTEEEKSLYEEVFSEEFSTEWYFDDVSDWIEETELDEDKKKKILDVLERLYEHTE